MKRSIMFFKKLFNRNQCNAFLPILQYISAGFGIVSALCTICWLIYTWSNLRKKQEQDKKDYKKNAEEGCENAIQENIKDDFLKKKTNDKDKETQNSKSISKNVNVNNENYQNKINAKATPNNITNEDLNKKNEQLISNITEL